MNLEKFYSPRILSLSLICILALTLATSFFYQFFFNFTPCFLCTLQRVCFFVLLISLSVKFAKNSKSLFLNIVLISFNFLGIFFSSRQVVLQNKVLSESSSFLCSPNVDTNSNSSSLGDFISQLFSFEGSCTDISSTLFGVSFAAWSLSIFLSSLVFILLIVVKERKN